MMSSADRRKRLNFPVDSCEITDFCASLFNRWWRIFGPVGYDLFIWVVQLFHPYIRSRAHIPTAYLPCWWQKTLRSQMHHQRWHYLCKHWKCWNISSRWIYSRQSKGIWQRPRLEFFCVAKQDLAHDTPLKTQTMPPSGCSRSMNQSRRLCQQGGDIVKVASCSGVTSSAVSNLN